MAHLEKIIQKEGMSDIESLQKIYEQIDVETICTCTIDEEGNLTIDNKCYWHGK